MTGIFTNEDYAIGGSPKIQPNTVALGFINQSHIDQIDDLLCKHAVQSHTENTIINLHNRRVDYIGFHNQPDDVIEAAYKVGYKVVIVCDVGTFINSQPLISMLKSINEGYALIGHILDKRHKYYQLHNQCFVLDLEAWEEVGRPRWDDREDGPLQKIIRSGENFHDDYTPMELAKGQGTVNIGNPDNGSKIISQLVKNNYKIRPFNEDERNGKYFLYHNDEWKANLRINDYHEKNFYPTYAYFYAVETEKTPKLKIDDNITSYVGICASLHPFKMIRHFELDNLRQMVLYDISSSAVMLYQGLEAWDGEDYLSAVRSSNALIGTRTDEDIKKYFDETKQFCEPWEFVLDIFHDTQKMYEIGNLMTDKIQRQIMHKHNKSDNVLFHVSNIFNYEITNHDVSIYYRYFAWLNLLFYAKKYTNRTHFIGSNIFGRSHVNTDDLDLQQCLDYVDEITFTPWQEAQKEKFKESIVLRYEKNMNVSI